MYKETRAKNLKVAAEKKAREKAVANHQEALYRLQNNWRAESLTTGNNQPLTDSQGLAARNKQLLTDNQGLTGCNK